MKKFVAIVFLLPALASAQTSTRPGILILGTYHMASPGRDIFNMQTDDVLSPKRQQDIAQVIETLKKFKPTKIAIESHVASKRAVKEYADYLTGAYKLGPNEIDQIGYRLAKELGHKTIYPVDEDGDFPYTRVVNYAKANDRKKEFDAVEAKTAARVKAEGEYLHTHSILEMLQFINGDSLVSAGVAEYYNLVPFGEPYEYAGSDLLAAWFQRNIRIYRNIHALIESPTERILVIYGSGHLGWLRQDVANDATVQLWKLSDLTQGNH